MIDKYDTLNFLDLIKKAKDGGSSKADSLWVEFELEKYL